MKYCGWLKFRGVPIFVVFVEGAIHEFQYPQNGNFLHELWKKILWPRNFEPHKCVIFVQSTKIGTHENKAIHSTQDYKSHDQVYCKRGYFRWGKISRKCCQDLSLGGNFRDSSQISLIKSYGFYFRVGEIFAKKTISRKTRKLPPRENFHVYSILIWKTFTSL